MVLLLTVSFLSIVASAADLVNVAKGKRYTVDIGPEGKPNYEVENPGEGKGCGDGENASRQRLTDGVVGGTDGGEGGIPGAQQTAKAIYVIDLGSKVNGIKQFCMDMYYGAWGILEPKSVEYAISDDKNSFTVVGTVEKKDAVNKVNDAWKGDNYILTLNNAVSARYIRVTATGQNFIWSTEIQVFADPSAANDSSSSQSTSSQSSTSSQTSSSKTSSSQSSSSKAPSNSQVSSSKASNPQTGDSGIAVFAVMAFISGGVVYSVNKRRRSVSE